MAASSEKDKDPRADAAVTAFTQCHVEGCVNRKNICRGCRQADPDACPEHVDPDSYEKVGPFMVHKIRPSDSSYIRQSCILKLCTTCWTNKPVSCAGTTIRYGAKSACAQKPNDGDPSCTLCLGSGCSYCASTCAKCRGWKTPTRCNECAAAFAKDHTCSDCSKATETLWTCRCKRRACQTCMPYVDVDVSPMTLFPGRSGTLAYASSVRICKECMAKTSEKAIQDEERERLLGLQKARSG